ncbi:hypothetical protein EF847_04910 [Actinobacteria bacterium YIM 96077]|uniref:Uncharacterized protein n=1 Tax=Phytoactinopolyspora halophila TaxID=1981511 RepID=A0A329R254_9ACTN|nr:hypothetical protein [Phytoactinopolyspora halophila]AYY12144.1 hypothetical protein EF847_04910 [Actinobacteria bacterium YIM 96077]RAW18621.1 hypothetical protein DPM12_00605 [Phytoactinopolyspora halophila]
MRDITGYFSSAVLVLVLAACDDDPAVSADDCAGPPEVTVTEPGAEPHEIMEHSPTAGDTATLDMRTTTEISAEVDGDRVPASPVPPMLLGMELTVDEVGDDEIAMSFVYDYGETPGGDPAVQRVLDSLVGVSGSVTTTRSGAFVDGGIDEGDLDPAMSEMVDQLEQQLAQLTIPLPAEPVGVGAAWEAASSVEIDGVTTCNFTTYRLAEFDGDDYELEVGIDQQIVPATVQEGSASVEIIEGEGHGTGRNGGSLSLPIAVSGTSEATTRMRMNVEQGGTEQEQELTVDVELEISPRE